MTDLDQHLPHIVAGDPDAFARWLAGAEAPLRRSLRPFAALVDTEAVLQEALLRCWQAAPRCKPDGRQNGLLRLGLTAARNLALSELRRQKLAPQAFATALAIPEPATDDWRPPDPLLAAHIQDCRERLPRQPRAALEQRLQNGGSDPDRTLAERLGMHLNTFLQNITRARKLLAECLQRHGVDLDLEQA